MPPLSSLGQLCDGKHTRQGWQIKTPACAHNQWLPRSFCQALAQRVVPLLQKAKLRLPLREATAASRGFVRQHKFPALVPEFRAIVPVQLLPSEKPPPVIPPAKWLAHPNAPPGAILLTRTAACQAALNDEGVCNADRPHGIECDNVTTTTCFYAVKWSPAEFFAGAMKCPINFKKASDFRILGHQEASSQFPTTYVPAACSLKELQRMAPWTNA